MKKALKILSKCISAAGLMLLCLLAIWVISSKASGGEPSLIGYQAKAVLSGSMEPTFMTGSIIIVKQPDRNLKKEDIITFKSGDKLITHRIIEVKKTKAGVLYQTKGDNNDAPDMEYVQPENITGKYVGFTIPYAGYAAEFAASKEGSALLLFIPGLLLMLSAARTIFLALKEYETKNA
ncbi:signal peptidase I SipW [Cytobacillus oceanisediminis]|uniref:signal peptidase I SipW n=1 Tax=Cytobacillus oceanisediminis TaxID=665099 RepID=UPI00203AE50D|nr:signal peptidase I [Cytobacillus oceanisediminis]MCM3392400.1 signal peptidase I [Cytobacillus oceanisediminis]